MGIVRYAFIQYRGFYIAGDYQLAARAMPVCAPRLARLGFSPLGVIGSFSSLDNPSRLAAGFLLP